jgi:hypothetical protein
MLMRHADAERDGIGRAMDIGRAAIDGDTAGIGGVAAEEDVHQRGLAGAVLAQQPQHIAGMEREIDVVGSPNSAEALADASHGKKLGARHDPPDAGVLPRKFARDVWDKQAAQIKTCVRSHREFEPTNFDRDLSLPAGAERVVAADPSRPVPPRRHRRGRRRP